MEFKLHSEYQPTGDQPEAIAELVKGFQEGNQFQTLLGVTGSGKTFTMANIIAALNKPTLIIAHNKTLAGQLYGEMKEFFPENAVEYFVSYYDYYQPEAYVPSTDTYIAKDSAVNEEIDKLLKAGCQIRAYDPAAMQECKRRIGDSVYYACDMYDAVLDADALMLVTEWKEFRLPSWAVIRKTMAQQIVLDGRNIYDKKEMEELGFVYSCIGK